MRIRGHRGKLALPPDVESSTLQPLPPLRHPHKHLLSPLATKSSVSSGQDELVGNQQYEDTAQGKNNIPAKPRKYACNPSSEISTDTDSSISSSSSRHGHWLEEDKLLPFKKRRSVQLDLKSKEPRNANIERELKSSNAPRPSRKRTEKIWTDFVLEVSWVAEKPCHKTAGNNSQRCNRQNGKGWRCSSPAFAGHTVCEHHLTEQRKKSSWKKKKKKKRKTVYSTDS